MRWLVALVLVTACSRKEPLEAPVETKLTPADEKRVAELVEQYERPWKKQLLAASDVTPRVVQMFGEGFLFGAQWTPGSGWIAATERGLVNERAVIREVQASRYLVRSARDQFVRESPYGDTTESMFELVDGTLKPLSHAFWNALRVGERRFAIISEVELPKTPDWSVAEIGADGELERLYGERDGETVVAAGSTSSTIFLLLRRPSYTNVEEGLRQFGEFQRGGREPPAQRALVWFKPGEKPQRESLDGVRAMGMGVTESGWIVLGVSGGSQADPRTGDIHTEPGSILGCPPGEADFVLLAEGIADLDEELVQRGEWVCFTGRDVVGCLAPARGLYRRTSTKYQARLQDIGGDPPVAIFKLFDEPEKPPLPDALQVLSLE